MTVFTNTEMIEKLWNFMEMANGQYNKLLFIIYQYLGTLPNMWWIFNI